MTEQTNNGRWWIYCHEAFFSLNLAFAIVYALVISGFAELEERYLVVAPNSFRYFFFRGSLRVSWLLHWRVQNRWSPEIMFSVSVLAGALLLISILRLLAGTALHRAILKWVAAVTGPLALPAALLYARTVQWRLASLVSEGTLFSWAGFWKSAGGILSIADIVLVIGFLLLIRRSRMYLVFYIALSVIQYGLWVFSLWDGNLFLDLVSVKLLMIALAWCVPAWFFYVRKLPETDAAVAESRRNWKYAVPVAAVAIAAIFVLWLPGRSYSLVHARDRQSLVITMGRSGGMCPGCPFYTISIHGNGQVHYSGDLHVKVHGSQTAQLNSDQLAELLNDFDRIHFFAIDDRAFEQCSDGGYVSISVFVDGREKRLRSTTWCIGARGGAEDEFIRLAERIDAVVGSSRWVVCDGRCDDYSYHHSVHK